ncbi:MAG: dihydrolipoamide acetyltransferase [Myxococcota bacterium]
MSLAPPDPKASLASGCALIRFALCGAVLGWLWLAGPAHAQDPDPTPPSEAPATPDATPESETPDPTDPADATDATASLARPEDDAAARRHAASEFHRELRSVEEQVSQLKERVFRSKATLKLLKELVVDAAAAGSRVMLWHVNDLGGGYGLESVQYFLDGKNVFTKIDPEGTLDDLDELKFHEQTLPPGEHTLQVNLVLRGKGHRIFSYLESFQFKVQSSYTFTIEEGKVSLIRVVVDSRGGFKNFEDRPTVRYDERKHTYRETDDADGMVALPEGKRKKGRKSEAPEAGGDDAPAED